MKSGNGEIPALAEIKRWLEDAEGRAATPRGSEAISSK